MSDVFERTARFEHRFWLQILGDHSLMADHMLREECYYLMKLAELRTY